MAMTTANRIAVLAAIISEQTKIVDNFLQTKGLPTPSLDWEAPPRLPIPQDAAHVEQARKTVIDATSELQALMQGPAELLRVPWTDNVSLHATVRFGIAKAFPVDGEASFAQIASKIGLSESTTRRLLRHAMTTHLFTEPRPGIVAHTGLTRMLAEDEMMHTQVLNGLDNLWPAACKVVDALEKWPDSEEPNETAFSLANNTDKTMWEVYKEQPVRGEIFGQAMGSMKGVRGYEPELLHRSFPWQTLGNATVVDLGGGHGQVMVDLARAFPKLKCVVQDLPEVAEEGKGRLEADIADRVTFMGHNFFDEQPVSADIYYTRSIMHNWSDKYCILMLRKLLPTLKSGARILAHEVVVPDSHKLSASDEKRIRHLDIGMLQLLNARQRNAKEFEELFTAADPRFRLVEIRKPPGGTQSIVEVIWE